MADYGVNIKFNIVGESGLDRAKKKAEELAKSVDNIRGIDIENPRNVGGKGGKKSRNQIKKYRQDMDNLVKKINETGEAFGKTHDAQNATAESLQKYVNGVEIGTKRHKDATQALRTQTKNLDLNNSQYLQNTKVQNQNTKATKENSKAKQQNAKYQKGNMGNIASSAIIGGAFPLLFGQTGAAATGGAIGGLAGGMLGGQFGFALSILGTAVGQFTTQQDKMNESVAQLDSVLRNAGSSAGFTRDNIGELATALNVTKDEALQMASAFARFGDTGQAAAFIFGDNPNTFKNLAAVQDTRTAMAAILDTSNKLSITQQIQLLREAKVAGFKNLQLSVSKALLQANLEAELSVARQIKNTDRVRFILGEFVRITNLIATFGQVDLGKVDPDLFLDAAQRMEQRVAKVLEKFAELEEGLPTLQELMKELNLEMESMSYSIPTAMDKTSAELRKLMSTSFMVVTAAETIGDAFGESFKGIVTGSMTAQEALRNLFQRTANHFLDMASQMIAKHIQMQILGIGLNFLSSGIAGQRGGSPTNELGSGGTDRFGRDFDSEFFGMPRGFENKFDDTGAAIIPGRALGGPVKRGGSYLVGERGPELFNPGVSGMITPNHALGGSTSVVVNVDASGSTIEGDEQQSREFGRLISVAVQSEIANQQRPGGLLFR